MIDACDKIWLEGKYKWTPSYHTHVFWLKKSMKALGSSLLDVGCGDGSYVNNIITKKVDYTGIDHSEIAIGEGVKKGFNVMLGDAECFGFEKKFDVIIVNDVLEHINDDVACLKCCCKNLRSGGTLIVSTPIHMKYWSGNDDEFGHKRRYDPDGIIRMLEAEGFEIVEVRYWGFLIPNFLFHFREVFKKHKRNLIGVAKIIGLADCAFSNRLFSVKSKGMLIKATKKEELK